TVLSLSDLQTVRFASATSAPFQGTSLRVVYLKDDQRITGTFLSLDEKSLHARTAWSDRLILSRRSLCGVTPLPGLLPVVEEDFEHSLDQWKCKGEPALSDRP